MKIKDKVALVLGAGRGLGRVVARDLVERGATVVLPFHTDWPADPEDLQREFAAKGGKHLVVRTDLREQQEVKNLISSIGERFGALHILINNIERGGMPVVHGSYDLEVNRQQWDLEMATTLKAKWLVVHHALELMKKSGAGVIINFSSIAGLVGRSGPAGTLFSDGYAAANRAVSSFTETWAREGAPTVRVNELMLGIFETRHGAGTRGWAQLSAGEKKDVLSHTLLERVGRSEEAAKAVVFLIEEADFMTGTVLRLDGGYVLGGDHARSMPKGILASENS